MTKKRIGIILCAAVLIIGIVLGGIYLTSGGKADEISIAEAQNLIDDAFEKMPGAVSTSSMKYIAQNSSVKVNNITYGNEKNIICDCSFSSLDAKDITVDYYKEIEKEYVNDPAINRMASTKVKLLLSNGLYEQLLTAEKKQFDGQIIIYQTKDGYEVYTDDKTVDNYFGGIVSAKNEIEKISDKKYVNFKNGYFECIKADYSSKKPDTSGAFMKAWNNFLSDFNRNFIANNNWQYIVDGLWVTIKVTFFALLIGILLGFLVAIIRCTNQKTGKLKISNAICKLYLTIVRGTPVLVQLMIIYFVIFMPINVDKFKAAVICFGLNSGAYVAEIVRGGIMSVDEGQTEAGRSLGFNYIQTMTFIVVPQAFKAVLPALANEFIVLLKETSVSAYIGLNDLARGGDIIRGVTYSSFMPLLAVAVIYLIMVVALSALVNKLERRLRNNER